uniref:Uncharacterized protein n=1 Tax=Pelusios castaneus TaxID=367368 RepID=A0A8C8SP47_9SAUR
GWAATVLPTGRGRGKPQRCFGWGSQPGHRARPPRALTCSLAWAGGGVIRVGPKFIQLYFLSDDDLTIEDSYMKICNINRTLTQIDFLDAGGQEEFALPVCASNDHNSFHEISKFHTQILQIKNQDEFPMILLSNEAKLPWTYSRRCPVKRWCFSRGRIISPTSSKIHQNMDKSSQSIRAIGRFQVLEDAHGHVMHPQNKESESCPCCIL